MITGSHPIIYAENAEEARAFFRDVLDFPYVDAHGVGSSSSFPRPSSASITPETRGSRPAELRAVIMSCT
jgi:catechol 2,3-dioxygenase-like lactoylglutathione lyase family enzyme